MLGQSPEWQRARPGSPFANSTEAEAWTAAWCQRCHHDVDEKCPLLTLAICAETPMAWHATGSGVMATKYRCLEWMPRAGE